MFESEESKDFLKGPFNAVGDDFRSPWTNQLLPSGKEADEENALERSWNPVWEAYKNLYYGHEAVSSVFVETNEDDTFQAYFGIAKGDVWHSWHSVQFEPATQRYHVDTWVWTVVRCAHSELGASWHKETTKVCPGKYYMENIGKILEANEMELRSNLERVHIPKAKEFVDELQKEKTVSRGVNPLMGMIMNSDMLKKKLAREQDVSTTG